MGIHVCYAVIIGVAIFFIYVKLGTKPELHKWRKFVVIGLLLSGGYFYVNYWRLKTIQPGDSFLFDGKVYKASEVINAPGTVEPVQVVKLDSSYTPIWNCKKVLN